MHTIFFYGKTRMENELQRAEGSVTNAENMSGRVRNRSWNPREGCVESVE